MFIKLIIGVNVVVSLFSLSLINRPSKLERFSLTILFNLGLIFEGKSRSLPKSSIGPFKPIIEQAGKAFHLQTVELIWPHAGKKKKKVYNIDSWCQCCYPYFLHH